MNTTNKTVIVTGASSGIGYALVEAYLKRGYNVVGNARTAERLQAAAAKLGNPKTSCKLPVISQNQLLLKSCLARQLLLSDRLIS